MSGAQLHHLRAERIDVQGQIFILQLDHGSVLRRWILVAEQTVRCFVLLDLRETSDRRIEAIVGVVVVALADFAQQDGAGGGFDLEIVVHILLDMNALARRELDLRSSGDNVGSAVAVNGHVRFLVDGLVGQAFIDANEDVAAAAVDDVLGLVPMEVVRGILPLLHIEQLLSVDLRILVLHGTIAVADRNERHTDLVKVAETVIGDVPAEHTVAHLVVFMPLGLPFFGREVAERRQEAMLACAHSFEFF